MVCQCNFSDVNPIGLLDSQPLFTETEDVNQITGLPDSQPFFTEKEEEMIIRN